MRGYPHNTRKRCATSVSGDKIHIADAIGRSTGGTITSIYLITPMIFPSIAGKVMKDLFAVTDGNIRRRVNIGHRLYVNIETNRSRIVTRVSGCGTQLRRAGNLPIDHHRSAAGRSVENAAGGRIYCPYQASCAAIRNRIGMGEGIMRRDTKCCGLGKATHRVKLGALSIQGVLVYPQQGQNYRYSLFHALFNFGKKRGDISNTGSGVAPSYHSRIC